MLTKCSYNSFICYITNAKFWVVFFLRIMEKGGFKIIIIIMYTNIINYFLTHYLSFSYVIFLHTPLTDPWLTLNFLCPQTPPPCPQKSNRRDNTSRGQHSFRDTHHCALHVAHSERGDNSCINTFFFFFRIFLPLFLTCTYGISNVLPQ